MDGMGINHIFSIKLHNSGQTPAREIEVTLIQRTMVVGDEKFILNEGKTINVPTMGAGVVWYPHIEIDEQSLSTDITRLADGGHRLYFFGMIRYRDILEQQRVTTFRHRNPFPRHVTSGEMEMCEEGNCDTY